MTPKSIREVLNQLPELTKKKEMISLLSKSLDFGISACILIKAEASRRKMGNTDLH